MVWTCEEKRRKAHPEIALSFEVEGRPVRRPKKTWRKVVEEDMRLLNIT